MDKIKVISVFGTRPEAIKMAPLVKHLNSRQDEFESIVCVTAQHREMLDQVLEIFDIEPKYDLDIMQDRQTLTGITTRALNGLEDVLLEEKPDIVLVHGDTSTTFVASLAAFYQKIAVGHVEAGLRTYNKFSPYPEEINRQLTGVLADIHFAPTDWSENNLLNENKKADNIFVTGNTVIDAFQTTVREDYSHPVLESLGNRKMVLMTSHRRENLGKPMEEMFSSIRRLIDEHEDIVLVYPVHLNPAVQEIANKTLGGHDRIQLIKPLDVVDFHNFMARAHLVLSDSGGVQEEAPSFGVPVLVLRDTTERPEGIEAGTLKLVGTNGDDIFNTAHELLTNAQAYEKMSKAANPYGDGQASRRIAEVIKYYFGKSDVRPESFSAK